MRFMKIILLCVLFSGCAAVVTERPSQPEVVVIPTAPGEGFIWINDSWDWNPGIRTYEVQRGYWYKPTKKKQRVWIDGHWQHTRRGWKYVRGHWR